VFLSSSRLTPLTKGFLDKSCEVAEGVMHNQVQVFPTPCEVDRCE
jgi:hypothetical protein